MVLRNKQTMARNKLYRKQADKTFMIPRFYNQMSSSWVNGEKTHLRVIPTSNKQNRVVRTTCPMTICPTYAMENQRLSNRVNYVGYQKHMRKKTPRVKTEVVPLNKRVHRRSPHQKQRSTHQRVILQYLNAQKNVSMTMNQTMMICYQHQNQWWRRPNHFHRSVHLRYFLRYHVIQTPLRK